MCLSSTNTSHADRKVPSSGDNRFPRFKRSLLILELWRKCWASTRLIGSRVQGRDRTVEMSHAVCWGRRIVSARYVKQGQPTGPGLGIILYAVVDAPEVAGIQRGALPFRSKVVLPRPLLLVQVIGRLTC